MSSLFVSSRSAARRSVSGLSDRGLLSATATLAKNERLTTLEILAHLNEVEKRELYLGLGCGSMLDYCVHHLGYSRSAAGRRIHAARCIARFPEVYELVENDALNLTTLSMIATVLTKENKTELIERVRGQSQDEVDKILAAYRPPIAFRDRVKPVRVAVPVTEDQKSPGGGYETSQSKRAVNPATGASAAAPGLPGATIAGLPREPKGDSSADATGTSNCAPRYTTEKQLLVQFLVSEGFMTKYQEVRSILSNKLPQTSFANVFEATLDAFLDKHSPARKHERRQKRKNAAKVQKTATASPREPVISTRETDKNPAHQKQYSSPGTKLKQLSRKKFDEQSRSGTLTRLNSSVGEDHSKTTGPKCGAGKSNANKPSPKKNRHIPAKTHDAVFVRDKCRCTHVGTNGKRCESIHRLHIDHIIPFARGGTNALSNLRVLCAKHNKLEAKRVYGAARIDAHYRRE